MACSNQRGEAAGTARLAGAARTVARPPVLPGCAALWLAACQCSPEHAVAFVAAPTELDAVQELVNHVGDPRLEVVEAPSRGSARIRAVVEVDLDCRGCYRLERQADGVRIRAGDLLGAQYGASRVLESLGYGFPSPYRAVLPESLPAAEALEGFDETVQPETELRGLHLHTLHPIESYFDTWEPTDESLARAERIIDWVVKQRGNYLQWLALDDILNDGATASAWRDHTLKILAYAARRGVQTGIGVQLFGSNNLQNAFDLLDSGTTRPPAEEMRARLELLRGLPFDRIALSFGEFGGEPPERLLAMTDLAYQVMQEVLPGVEITASVHVGNFPNLRIEYQGERLLYYFLVKYADPRIVPWVHTVMFYNLFEDAGGAYLHDDFAEHREFLLQRLRDGKRVGYFPESAYWIAFDNSVPQYFPLYVRSRWTDLWRIREAAHAGGFAGLREHVLFSTGWEWGYWQNDAATLRMTYQLPERWEDAFVGLFGLRGPASEAAEQAATELTRLQHQALLVQRLAPFVAGRDMLLDAGEKYGIVSQPTRPSFESVASLTADARTAFVRDRLEPLEQLGADVRSIEERLGGSLAAEDPRHVELLDGLVIDALRPRFIAALYRAVLAVGTSDSPTRWLDEADRLLEQAREVVKRRHQQLWDPSPTRLRTRGPNATFYSYGYLHYASVLCYWERERIQARQRVLGDTTSVPGCVL